MDLGLYVHVPFCAQKCAYCDFYSVPLNSDHAVRSYLEALGREMASFWPSRFQPSTVYIGGGTPTVLPNASLEELLALIGSRVRCVTEWSVEANPGTLSESKARLLKERGVNRISLGVQSAHAELLRRLGRIHSPQDAFEAYELLRDVGFENIGIDLMFGIPGQTLDMLRKDLAEWIERKPKHISCYALSFEPGTSFARWLTDGVISEMSSDEQRNQYELLREMLREAGYVQYEISNFAQPGFECLHNQICWRGGEYIGYGPSAHSHWEGTRWGNVRDIGRWVTGIQHTGQAREFEERLEPMAKAGELLMLNLRLTAGVQRSDFRAGTGYDWHEVAGDAIERLKMDGLLVETSDRLQLAEIALFISDAVFRELI